MPPKNQDDMVVLVNKVTRNKMSLAAEEVELFLRKHKLYEKVHVASPEEKKVRRKSFVKKPPVVPSLKRGLGEESVKSSPSSWGDTAHASKRMKKEREFDLIPLKLEPVVPKPTGGLLVFTLQEMHEITRLFTSSPPGCADWAAIANSIGGDRFTAAEIEHAANEFLPHIHFRPSIGLVVMERSGAKHSEFLRHRMTLKRMKQGLPIMAQKFKSQNSSETLPEENSGSTRLTVANFLAQASESTKTELRSRAATAIARFVAGEVPQYALRVCASEEMTATGRVKKRYETKAIRLAKAAAGQPTAVPKSVSNFHKPAPAFFFSTARHFGV